MQLFKTPNIRFLKYKYIALAATAVIVLAGVLNVTVFKGLKLGVDFGEGTLLRVKMRTASSEGDIRNLLQTVGLGKSQVQSTGDTNQEFQIRALESAGSGGTAEEQLEAHEELANKSSPLSAATTGRPSGPAGSSTSTRSTRGRSPTCSRRPSPDPDPRPRGGSSPPAT